MRRSQRSNPFSRVYSALAILVLSSVLCVLIAEWASGLALKAIKDRRPILVLTNSDEEIAKIYDTDNPGLYREIQAESWRMGDTVYSPFVEFAMQPYQGKHFTITEQGFRANGAGVQDVNAPGPKVFVFGGSTTMGSGVADDQTIPAYLGQALKAAGKDAQVFNFGVVSWFSTQERILLERFLTAGVKPDVAVFVDGLNDFYYCTVPDQSAWNERLVQTTRARSRMPLGIELANRSNVVQLARHLGGDKSVAIGEWGSFCNSDADVAKVAARLDANRRMIDAMAERMGFKAVFVQQPVPTFHYDNRKRPFPVREEMLAYHTNSAKGYPLMDEMRNDGRLFTKNLLWLAELEPAEGNAYIDTVHYSPRFNKAIADKLAEHILGSGLLP